MENAIDNALAVQRKEDLEDKWEGAVKSWNDLVHDDKYCSSNGNHDVKGCIDKINEVRISLEIKDNDWTDWNTCKNAHSQCGTHNAARSYLNMYPQVALLLITARIEDIETKSWTNNWYENYQNCKAKIRNLKEEITDLENYAVQTVRILHSI